MTVPENRLKTKENQQFSLGHVFPSSAPRDLNFEPHQLEYEHINILLWKRARKHSRSSRTLFLALGVSTKSKGEPMKINEHQLKIFENRTKTQENQRNRLKI